MKKGPIIAIAAVVLLSIGLYFLPTTSTSTTVETEVATKEVEVNDLDKKVADAVEIIQNSTGAPMRGVAMLKEVLAEDPNHIGANYWLGEFSWISGQFEKAVPRYEVVLKAEPSNSKVALKLSDSFLQLNENEKAKSVLNTFIELNPKHGYVGEMKNILNNIK